MANNLFVDPQIQRAFVDYERQQRLRLTKIGAILVALLMPAGTTLDQNVYPEQMKYFLFVRLVSSFLALGVLGLLFLPWGQRHSRALSLGLPILPSGCIAWMIYVTQGSLSPYYAGLALVLVAMSLMLPWSFREILLLTGITLTFYLAACVFHGVVQPSGIFFNNFYFLFLTAVVVVIGSYFTYRLRVREFALRFELDQNRKKLEESNQKLVELDQVKSRFFANISHELRTPLTLLIGPLETLRLKKAQLFDEETRGLLQTMDINSMRLLKLINDLLDLVKLESGRMEVKREALELREFVIGMVHSVQKAASEKKILIQAKAAEELGTVLLDKDKMEKIILNLLFNAVKFTPIGGHIELSCVREGGDAVMRVKDTGVGISEKDLPHIFDRFWQADGSSVRKQQGTGIGLALVKELVEVQDGKVLVESKINQGTTITVRLPAEKASPAVSPEIPIAIAEAPEKKEDDWLLKLYRRAELFPPMATPLDNLRSVELGRSRGLPRVLVADDEPEMRRFLKNQLGKHFEILEAVDGQQALEKAKQFLPDLILLDMMMPEKDGLEVCRELRGYLPTQAIPIVHLTARADEETKLASLSAGASDFLTKPFSTTELHVRLKNLVDSYHFQSELAQKNRVLESTMEQLKETETSLVQTEKMSSLGRMSAGMIHEINNPLNYALTALHILESKKEKWPLEERPKLEELLADIKDGMTRVQRIVTDLRSFTHPHSNAVDLVELNDVISTAMRFLSHELNENVQVTIDVPKNQQILADKNKLTHVFINLFQNAIDATRKKKYSGEKPTLSVRSQMNGSKVIVGVRDNGTGISSKYLNKIFDPFFTTKDVGEGMGLGLSICYRIMQEQGGRISVKSEEGKYTEFDLEIPVKIN
jgi:signal transduction histidine kinase